MSIQYLKARAKAKNSKKRNLHAFGICKTRSVLYIELWRPSFPWASDARIVSPHWWYDVKEDVNEGGIVSKRNCPVDLDTLVAVFNYFAIFVAAISGAAAGMKKKVDFFGVSVLAFATACSGGILRDLLIGDLPPDNIKSSLPLVVALSGGFLAFVFFPYLQGFLQRPVLWFDAMGLGLFTALGANKALAFGISPIWSVVLGVITGIGGGVVRDIMLARIPLVLHAEIYATASLVGGAIIVAGHYIDWVQPMYSMIFGAAVCILLRCLALHYNWNIPAIPPISSRYKVSERRRKE